MQVNAYSAWLNGKGSVSVLCGVESDSLVAMSMGQTPRLVRTCIHVFSADVFAKSFGIASEKLTGTAPQAPFNFAENGLQPVNLKGIFGKDVRIQIIETSNFDDAVKYGIINEKDANGTYVVRDSAYKLDRETKSRVVDAHGNFVYRKCFLRPESDQWQDVLVTAEQRKTVDLSVLTENQPVAETVASDDVPF